MSTLLGFLLRWRPDGTWWDLMGLLVSLDQTEVCGHSKCQSGDKCRQADGLVWHLAYTLHLTPCTLNLTPCSLHLAPYTLNLTPFALHLTPYTLHLAPYLRRCIARSVSRWTCPRTPRRWCPARSRPWRRWCRWGRGWRRCWSGSQSPWCCQWWSPPVGRPLSRGGRGGPLESCPVWVMRSHADPHCPAGWSCVSAGGLLRTGSAVSLLPAHWCSTAPSSCPDLPPLRPLSV